MCPSLYEVSYHADGTLKGFAPVRTGYRPPCASALSWIWMKHPFPSHSRALYRDLHDRIALEIMRGCTRGCRFCQAGMLYRPVRERSPEKLLALAEKLVAATGYEEISLSSLSSGDYGQLAELGARPDGALCQGPCRLPAQYAGWTAWSSRRWRKPAPSRKAA